MCSRSLGLANVRKRGRPDSQKGNRDTINLYEDAYEQFCNFVHNMAEEQQNVHISHEDAILALLRE